MIEGAEKPIFSFVVIADTHISDTGDNPRDSKTSNMVASGYLKLLDQINQIRPDFVIHLGDLTHPSPLSPKFTDAAQDFNKMSGRLSMPLHLIPGNHDIGEKIHRALPRVNPAISVSKHNIAQYEEHFGKQFHSFEHYDCVFVLINSLVINSGLEDEETQWTWLQQTLATAAGKRIFLFSHYPLFLTAANEEDHYDSIDQPGRDRLLALLQEHGVEGAFSGHVHNFFYNSFEKTRLFALPSTSINRHDYLEFFHSPPECRTTSRYDPIKTGFFRVDVFADGFVPHLIRHRSWHAPHTHAWRPKGAMPVVDLRVPWFEKADVLSPWGVEIFERKRVRNDYPLSALWEMGILDLRIPVSDLMDAETAERVSELSDVGHRFVVVMFGVPTPDQTAMLERHSTSLKAIEIVGFESDWSEFYDDISVLRKTLGCMVFFNVTKTEIQGYTSHHGIRTDCAKDLKWLSNLSNLPDTGARLVFNCPRGVSPLDATENVLRLLPDGEQSFALHVPSVIMHRTILPADKMRHVEELNRVAEATLVARAYPETAIVLDNFVELDRGYFHCDGLVSRLYEPKAGCRILATMAALMPGDFECTEVFQSPGCRVIVARDGSCTILLVLCEAKGVDIPPVRVLPSSLADKKGRLFDLSTGEESEDSFATFQNRLAADHSLFGPQMFFLESTIRGTSRLVTALEPDRQFRHVNIPASGLKD